MDDIKKYMDIVQSNSIDPKQAVLEELQKLDEGIVKGLFKLIGIILGSVARIAQITFGVAGGTAGFIGGGFRGISTNVLVRAIALIFDGLRLGANAGKFITGGIANLLNAPGKKLMDDDGTIDQTFEKGTVDKHDNTKQDAQVKQELAKIEKAVAEFVNDPAFNQSEITKDLELKMTKYFGSGKKRGQ